MLILWEHSFSHHQPTFVYLRNSLLFFYYHFQWHTPFLNSYHQRFLGCPMREQPSLSSSHRLVLEGRAGEAIRAATVGGVGGILITIILLPSLFLILPPLYDFLRPHIWLILILVSVYMIIKLSRNFEALIWASALFSSQVQWAGSCFRRPYHQVLGS